MVFLGICILRVAQLQLSCCSTLGAHTLPRREAVVTMLDVAVLPDTPTRLCSLTCACKPDAALQSVLKVGFRVWAVQKPQASGTGPKACQ